MNVPVFVLNTCASTNDEAKKLAKIHNSAVVIADGQTNGRGRTGHEFFSPQGKGLYMSVLLNITPKAAFEFKLTAAAAVAVVSALRKGGAKNPLIKWVNDVYENGKKVCGILTEACENKVIVGIGVNTEECEYPGELREKAGFCRLNITRAELAKSITQELFSLIKSGDFMEEYRENSMILGKRIAFSENGAEYEGIAERIEDNGSLTVKGTFGEKTLTSGEIRLI